MVVKEMSLRNRLSKSSENPEEKEDGGSPTKEPRDSPSDGETFHFCEVNEWNREQIQHSGRGIAISLALYLVDMLVGIVGTQKGKMYR